MAIQGSSNSSTGNSSSSFQHAQENQRREQAKQNAPETQLSTTQAPLAQLAPVRATSSTNVDSLVQPEATPTNVAHQPTSLNVNSATDGPPKTVLSITLQRAATAFGQANNLAQIGNNTAASSEITGRWTEFVGKQAQSGNVNINALVQAVLRDSYQENTKDLHFYAQKVKFYNELKAAIRDELTRARTVLSKTAGGEEASALSEPYQGMDWDTNFAGGTPEIIELWDRVSEAPLSGDSARPATAEDRSKLEGDLTGYQVAMTGAGYAIAYKGSTVKIFDPEGEEILGISGDPHVYNGGMDEGSSDWHFGEDSTFVLPDGTKLAIDTEPNANGEWYTVGVNVLSGYDRVTMDGSANDPVKARDRLTFDSTYADRSEDISAGVFMVSESGVPYSLTEDGNFYKVSNESWASYKSDRDIDVNTAQGYMLNDEETLAKMDGTEISDHLSAHGWIATKGELETYIKNKEEQLNSVGDDAQLANVDLQNMLQKQQQTMQQMSNISKMLHDTAMAIIRKIG